MSITQQTRRESFRSTDRLTRHAAILAAWSGAMTAREIGNRLGFKDLNAVKPRIDELVKLGALQEAGKKYDPLTQRNVTCWERPQQKGAENRLRVAE